MTSRMQLLAPLMPILVLVSCAGRVSTPEPVAETRKAARFTTHGANDWNPDWSPDGRWIAFESDRGGGHDIWIQPVAGGAAIQVTDHAASDASPKWSPDGARLLFVSERSGHMDLWTVMPFVEGQPVSQVTTAANALCSVVASWSPAGDQAVFLASADGSRDIWVKPVAGGPARRVTDGPRQENDPDWSPDGRWIAHSAGVDGGAPDLWVVPAAGGSARRVTSDAAANYTPAYSPDGQWIAYCTNTEDGFVVEMVPAAGGDGIRTGGAGVRPRWSPDGRKLCYQGGSEATTLWIAPLGDGEPMRLVDDTAMGPGASAAWSPDGTQVAFARADDQRTEIWKVNVDGGDPVALTSDGRVAAGAANLRWSPDGGQIAFVSSARGRNKVWIVPATGGSPKAVSTTPGEDLDMAWSPDGGRLAVASRTRGESGLWIVPVEGGTAERLVAGPGAYAEPHWSPDGATIAFASTSPAGSEQAGVWRIWRVAATGGEPIWLCEGRSPQWSGDGKALVHVWDGDVWTVPASGGEPTTLLALNKRSALPRVGPDGQSVLYSQSQHQTDIWIIDVSGVVGR